MPATTSSPHALGRYSLRGKRGRKEGREGGREGKRLDSDLYQHVRGLRLSSIDLKVTKSGRKGRHQGGREGGREGGKGAYPEMNILASARIAGEGHAGA